MIDTKEAASGPDTPRQHGNGKPPTREVQLERTLEHVREALRGLRFGSVVIVVQDGVVVQIERTERHRLLVS